MPTITQALDLATALGLQRLDTQWLLLHALARQEPELARGRAWLVAHGDDILGPEALARFWQYVGRRANAEPLAYITGERGFFGLSLRVDARVLVPRPDSELLVHWAIESVDHIAQRVQRIVRVLELGTGSGAIALALKAERPALHVEASDNSADALAVATDNANRLGLEVAFAQRYWLDGVAQHYDCIVSNPPYLAQHDPHLRDLGYEPASALVAGADGMADLRQIVAQARACLAPGGCLLLEHGYQQARAVQDLLNAHGFINISTRRDLGQNERCTRGENSL